MGRDRERRLDVGAQDRLADRGIREAHLGDLRSVRELLRATSGRSRSSAVHALVTGGIKGLITYFEGVPGKIGTALLNVGKAITKPFSGAFSTVSGIVTGGISALGRVLGGIASAIGKALSGVDDALSGPFKAGVKAIGTIIAGAKRLWNDFANVWNGIPGVHFGGQKVLGHKLPSVDVSLPHLPTFARGGFVRSPMLAIVWRRAGRGMLPASMVRSSRGGSESVTVNVHVSPFANPAEVGRQVVSAIRAYERGTGPGWRAAS